MFLNIKEIEVAELSTQLQQAAKQFRVVDVRQPTEMAQGMIPGAEMVPMHTIPLRMNEFSKDETLVLVCRSGARSAQACMFLQQQGYDNVYNLRGGMIAWSGSGQQMMLPQAV